MGKKYRYLLLAFYRSSFFARILSEIGDLPDLPDLPRDRFSNLSEYLVL